MVTIRKNSIKRIREILKNNTIVKFYTLSNNFSGEQTITTPESREVFFNDITSGRVKLTKQYDETYLIFYHSNYWAQLEATS
jgi:hypothetical protein